MPPVNEEIVLKTNIDEFVKKTEELHDNWDQFSSQLSQVALSGKKGSKGIQEMISRFREISDPINKLEKMRDLSQYMSAESFASLSNRIGEINQKMVDLAGKDSLKPKEVQQYNEFLEKTKDEFGTILETIENVKESSASSGAIEEKLNDLIQSSFSYRKNQIKQEISINKKLQERLKTLNGELSNNEKRIAQLKLTLKNWYLQAKAVKGVETALRGAEKAAKSLKDVVMAIPGIGLLLSLTAIIGKFWEMDKVGRELRKTIYDVYTASGQWLGSSVKGAENLQQQLVALDETLSQDLGTTVEWAKSLVDVGFKLDKNITENLKGVSAIATRIGISFGEMGQLFGQVREELGDGFDQLFDSFLKLTDEADDSRMTLNRFYSNVVNAASGLGIYGTKLIDVGGLFADLTKAMNLPEKAASEMATGMIQNFKDLSFQQRQMITSGSDFEKKLNDVLNSMKGLTAGSEESEKALQDFAELMTGRRDVTDRIRQMAKQFTSMEQSAARSVEALMRADPAVQFQTRFEKFLEALQINTNADIGEISQQFITKQVDVLQAIGEAFGFGSEEQIEALKQLVQGLAKQNMSIKDIGSAQREQDQKLTLKQLKETDRQLKEMTESFGEQMDRKITNWIERTWSKLSPLIDDLKNAIEKLTTAIENFKLPSWLKGPKEFKITEKMKEEGEKRQAAVNRMIESGIPITPENIKYYENLDNIQEPKTVEVIHDNRVVTIVVSTQEDANKLKKMIDAGIYKYKMREAGTITE